MVDPTHLGGALKRGQGGRVAHGRHWSPVEAAAAPRGWGAGPTRALRAAPAAASSRAVGEPGVPSSSVAQTPSNEGESGGDGEREASPSSRLAPRSLGSPARRPEGARPAARRPAADLGHRLRSWGAGPGVELSLLWRLEVSQLRGPDEDIDP